MKIRPVEAELFHTDGRTDLTKLIVAFRNIVKTPKSVYINTLIKFRSSNIAVRILFKIRLLFSVF
jgi:hypothetical protein